MQKQRTLVPPSVICLEPGLARHHFDNSPSAPPAGKHSAEPTSPSSSPSSSTPARLPRTVLRGCLQELGAEQPPRAGDTGRSSYINSHTGKKISTPPVSALGWVGGRWVQRDLLWGCHEVSEVRKGSCGQGPCQCPLDSRQRRSLPVEAHHKGHTFPPEFVFLDQRAWRVLGSI